MSQHVLALGTMATSIAKLKAEHEQCETDRAGFLERGSVVVNMRPFELCFLFP
jgi:hypothetical protein